MVNLKSKLLRRRDSSKSRPRTPPRRQSIHQIALPPKCTLCNRLVANGISALRCDKCKRAFYCSTYCKEEDSSCHDLICKAFRTFVANNPRPSPNHRLGLGLPVKAKSIKFDWYEDKNLGDTPPNLQDLQRDLCGFPDSVLTTMVSIGQRLKDANPGLGKFDLDHRVEMVFQRGGKGTSSGGKVLFDLEVNVCAQQIFLGSEYEKTWKGPIVLISRDLTRNSYQDVSTLDFRVLFDMLSVYSYSFKKRQQDLEARTKLQSFRDVALSLLIRDIPISGLVKGVRVNCLGDMQFMNSRYMIEQDVSRHHPIFDKRPTSISMHLGLPLIVMKYGDHPHWDATRKIKGERLDTCAAAPPLNISANLVGQNFCYITPEWTEFQVGSICVVRQDRLPISVNHVEAFVEFNNSYLAPLFIELNKEIENYSMNTQRRHRKLFIEDHMCRETFERYFQVFKADKIMKGFSTWNETFSPFLT
jgi:hypothetical protein